MDSSLQALAQALTDFGNLAVAGMAAVAAVLMLLRQRRPDLAACFGVSVVAVLVATAAGKVLSVNVGPSFIGAPWALSVGAPSGHASMAMVAYGGVALICVRHGAGRARILAPILALVVIAAVSVTRVTLHTHTPADVAMGLLVGGAPLALWRRRPPAEAQGSRLSPPRLASMVGLVAIVVHLSGARLTSTDFL